MIVEIGDVKIGSAQPLVLIAGPCVIEGERSVLVHAEKIKRIAGRLDVPYIFKSSYDKANRLSIRSFRGPGLKKGLKILKKVKDELGLPLLSDVHCVEEVKEAQEVLDVIQIPALLSRQTDLVVAAAKTKKAINLKKGQFMSPYDMRNIVEKAQSTGNKRIIVTERGTTFGYNNLVVDMRSIPIMQETGCPVIFDATHSVQMPGGLGSASAGERKFIPTLARAGVAAGCDGLFLEVHENPDRAPCDGPNMLALRDLEELLASVKEIRPIL